MPGLYGSNLLATYEKGFAKHWYCPKKMETDLFWVSYKFAIPPLYNCLFELMHGYYDPNTDSVTSEPGLTVDVKDFGGDQGISYVDKNGIFGHHFIESFAPMLEYFKKRGYTIKKDIFGAPYDWRLAMAGLEKNFFPKLKGLIEHAYDTNENQRVTILGYSCGGFCIQRFLTTFVSQEWKDKYVRKIIFLAPAFGGSGDTLDVAWNQYFPIIPFLSSKSIAKAIETVPAIHALFPNHVVFGDIPIVKGPSGEIIKAKDVPQFLIDHKKVTGNHINTMMKAVQISSQAPGDVGVPVLMLYNSKHETALTMHFHKGWNEEPKLENTNGDGTVPSIGPEWACNHWSGDKSVVCFDFLNGNKKFDHQGLSTNPYVHEVIFNNTVSDNWIEKKGARFEYAPHVDVSEDELTFTIMPHIRAHLTKQVIKE